MNPKYIITILLLLICSGTASAWLSGYDHRIAITVNNGGASTLNYYQFNFTNDTNTLVAAGHMQASGADCRVTDSSDNLVPFWNETAFNVSGTKIWANATTLTVGDNTFYMYYGNVTAVSTADIAGTFTFGDNFSVGPPSDPWTRYDGNPIISATSGQWDYGMQCAPDVLYNDSEYKLYYYGATGDANSIPRKIGMANGTDGYSFVKQNVVLPNGSVGNWDDHSITDPALIYYNGYYWLYYGGSNESEFTVTGRLNIGLAKSTDGYTFTRITNGIGSTSKVLERGSSGDWDYTVVSAGSIVYYDGYFWLYYWGRPLNVNADHSIGLAKSTDGVSFTKITNGLGGTSQVLNGTDYGGNLWEEHGVIRPKVFRYGSKWHMFYIGIYGNNKKEIGYANSTDGVNWVKSANNPIYGIGSADWENDYLPGVTTVFVGGNENNKCIMYYQGAYTPSNPTNRIAVANQTTAHDWDGTDASECKWTFSSTDAITIESGVMKVKAVTGGQHADVSTSYKPNFAEMDYDFVQEFDYKPTVGYTNYGVTSIGTMLQNSYAGGDNSVFVWHYGGTSDGGQSIKLRTCVDTTLYEGTNIAPYATNELYKFQAKKLAGNAVCKIWDTSHTETSPNVENTLTAKDNYNFPYVVVWTRPSYTQPAAEIDNYRIRKLVSTEPTSSLGAEEDAPAGNNDIILSANTYGFLRKDVTTAQTFSTITTGFAHKICFSWLDNSAACWESYWSGDAYNSDLSIPKNDAYFVLMDGTGETVSCGVRAVGNVAIPTGWYATYLGESTAKTLTQIKTDMQVDGTVTNLYTWDHNAGGTGAWVSVDVTPSHSVLPNQGILINNMGAGYNWDGTVS